jgi:DHA2 family methylenomycin A resistance protein-like MFS transporter
MVATYCCHPPSGVGATESGIGTLATCYSGNAHRDPLHRRGRFATVYTAGVRDAENDLHRHTHSEQVGGSVGSHRQSRGETRTMRPRNVSTAPACPRPEGRADSGSVYIGRQAKSPVRHGVAQRGSFRSRSKFRGPSVAVMITTIHRSAKEPDPAAGPHQPEHLDSKDRRWALLATSLGFGVVQLDVSVVNVAIKPIGADLGGSVSSLQWVVNAYTVAFAALILSAGALSDRIGARRVFIAGFVLFTAASAGCGLAPSLAVLITARAVQGIGAAVLVPCSLTLLNHAYPDVEGRARAVGLWAAGASVALSAGPLVGGVLTASLGWRAIFFINGPIGLLGIALTVRYAADTSQSRERGIDPPGQTAAVVALVALATAMVEGGQLGFTDALVLSGFAVAIIAGAVFVAIEARRARPMLPLGLFGSRTFATASAIGLVVNVAFYGLIFVFSLYFQTTRHYSALVTGLAFAPTTAAVLAANLLAGRIAKAVGIPRAITGAALLMTASLAGLLIISSTTAYPAIVAQLVVLGFGLGLVVPVMTSALLGSVDASRSGVAAGTLNTARQTGSVIGVALFGSLAATSLVGGLRLGLIISVGLGASVAALSIGIEQTTS